MSISKSAIGDSKASVSKTTNTEKVGELGHGAFWFKQNGDILTLGLTDLALEEKVGAPTRVELPEEGEAFSKGETLGFVEGSLGRLEVLAPFSGVVLESNTSAIEEPEMISDDPLEQGWLVRLESDTTGQEIAAESSKEAAD